MPCCGQQRRQATLSAPVGPLPEAAKIVPAPGQIYFQYVGATGLTATGAATGVRYRFDSPGATMAVDPRDQLSLMPIPQLRQVHPA